MTESKKRPARRATRVSRALAAARERNGAQLAEHERKQQRIDAALVQYFAVGDEIAAAVKDCERRIEPHERAIAALREQLTTTLAEHETTQGQAALDVFESDRTIEQVGELLGLGEKATRRLIAAGRRAREQDQPAGQPVSADRAEVTPPPMASVAGTTSDSANRPADAAGAGPVSTSISV